MSPPAASPEATAVVQANDGFYQAFQAMDLEQMDAVWEHTGDVTCVHPGWEPLVGWDDVRQSFLAIFAAEGWLRVAPDEVAVVVQGDLAWVRCIEVVSSISTYGPSQARVAATNLFRRTDGTWRMILHHGGPIAGSTELDLPEDDEEVH